MERGITRSELLRRGAVVLGVATFGPALAGRIPSAQAAGTFADEAGYLFDPRAPLLPDPALWRPKGGLEPVAVPRKGLGAAGVRSSLAFVHPTPPLPTPLGADVTAQLFTPPVTDDSGAWLDDAISPRLILDDGVVHCEVACARDPRTGERQLRLEGAPEASALPFAWDNGYANVIGLRRRVDGLVELSTTNMHPAGFAGLENQLYRIEVLPPSDGHPGAEFKWDRDGRSAEDGSCWVRVSSLWAGTGVGALELPAVANEIVVAFEEGDPDQPIITGSVYNPDRMPPFPLPFEPLRDAVTVTTSSGFGPLTVHRLLLEESSNGAFVFRERERRSSTTVRFEEIDPPFTWALRLEERFPDTFFPPAVAGLEDDVVASLLLELQIGDMTGARRFRLAGPRRRRTVLSS